MDLYIDETNLYNRMFLYTKQFDWEKMWAIADDITDEEAIRAKAQDILDTFDTVSYTHLLSLFCSRESWHSALVKDSR